jgi:hypothetical protein
MITVPGQPGQRSLERYGQNGKILGMVVSLCYLSGNKKLKKRSVTRMVWAKTEILSPK